MSITVEEIDEFLKRDKLNREANLDRRIRWAKIRADVQLRADLEEAMTRRLRDAGVIRSHQSIGMNTKLNRWDTIGAAASTDMTVEVRDQGADTQIEAGTIQTGSKGQIVGRAVPYREPITAAGGYIEIIDEQSFARSLKNGTGKRSPLLLHHDRDKAPIGRPLSWESQSDGLYAEWQLDMKSPRAAEAWRQASEGYLTGLSVGFAADPDADDIRTSNDGEIKVYRRNASLREVSLVSVPAYPSAQVTATRSRQP